MSDDTEVGFVYQARLTADGPEDVFIRKLPPDSTHPINDDTPEVGAGPAVAPVGPRDKVQPALRQLLASAPSAERHQLIVGFAEHLVIPRFPEPVGDEPRGSARNRAQQAKSDQLVQSIRANREARYAQLEGMLAGLGAGIEVRERYWLTSALLVEAPLGAVERIAGLPDVVSVELRYSGEPPPQQAATVANARQAINSDPYFSLGVHDTWVGLLDTGVHAAHRLLSNPSNLGLLRDCVTGGADCNTGANLDPDDVQNHGTATAAIITANSRMQDPFRGVTASRVDSYRVYTPHSVDRAAAKRGFQAAVDMLDKVVIAEIQAGGDDRSDLAQAADNAYDSGVAVIAANGNYGPNPSTVRSPANAHKVIGVGAYSIATGVQCPDQSRGPARDGRVKPDLQAPTDSVTATNNPLQETAPFGGTSGATPYVGGAAALLRSWLKMAGAPEPEPGLVYALLILFTQHNGVLDQTIGAGRLALRIDGVLSFGVLDVPSNHHVDLPDVVAGGVQTADAAIWWPEVAGDPDPHNTVTLSLVDPAGTIQASSEDAGSVFQRCSVGGGLAAGSWSVRVRGVSVAPPSQRVFWAAFTQP
jgi:hypothetical protein